MDRPRSKAHGVCPECGALLYAKVTYCWLCFRSLEWEGGTAVCPPESSRDRAAEERGPGGLVFFLVFVIVTVGTAFATPLGVLVGAIGLPILVAAWTDPRARTTGDRAALFASSVLRLALLLLGLGGLLILGAATVVFVLCTPPR